jgi:hypothetical protein
MNTIYEVLAFIPTFTKPRKRRLFLNKSTRFICIYLTAVLILKGKAIPVTGRGGP